MATLPRHTRVAVVDRHDLVTEIVQFDHTRDLVRDCQKFVDVSAHPEIQVGWRLRCGGIEAPPFDQRKGGE